MRLPRDLSIMKNLLNRRVIFFVILAALVPGLLYFLSQIRSAAGSFSIPPLPPPSFREGEASLIAAPSPFNGTWDYGRDEKNLFLNHDQCDEAFPGLYDEINRVVLERKNQPITVKEMDKIAKTRGYMRLMIYDQELYIVDKVNTVNSRNLATLHAIHKAMLTSPEPLPNIEFSINAEDKIGNSAVWSYTRLAKDKKTWLMPDFGFWSWPEALMGSYTEVAMKAAQVDSEVPWSQKTDKIIWRGATLELKVREDFLKRTQGKEWADVEELVWDDKDNMAKNYITMDDHCKYKYVAHTEGVSYSGRLKYIQNCRSTIVAHKLQWIQHYHHLMKSSGPDQNFVEVDREFKHLEETILDLRIHDQEAEEIAERSYRVFRERYLTPAAEVCYWRRLILGWSTVSFSPEFFEVKDRTKKWRGMPIESYMLLDDTLEELPPH